MDQTAPFLELLVGDVAAWRNRAGECWAVLSPEEQERANRFATPPLRLLYVVSHGALRLALAARLGQAAGSITLVKGRHGKPSLAGPAPPLCFNLSHSGDRFLIGLCDRSIGVDIEYMGRPGQVEDIAQEIFTAREWQRWSTLPQEQRTEAFYRAWTQKEACLKESGEGLSRSMTSVEVISDRRATSECGDWELGAVDVGPGYAAAYALAGSGVTARTPSLES